MLPPTCPSFPTYIFETQGFIVETIASGCQFLVRRCGRDTCNAISELAVTVIPPVVGLGVGYFVLNRLMDNHPILAVSSIAVTSLATMVLWIGTMRARERIFEELNLSPRENV